MEILPRSKTGSFATSPQVPVLASGYFPPSLATSPAVPYLRSGAGGLSPSFYQHRSTLPSLSAKQEKRVLVPLLNCLDFPAQAAWSYQRRGSRHHQGLSEDCNDEWQLQKQTSGFPLHTVFPPNLHSSTISVQQHQRIQAIVPHREHVGALDALSHSATNSCWADESEFLGLRR